MVGIDWAEMRHVFQKDDPPHWVCRWCGYPKEFRLHVPRDEAQWYHLPNVMNDPDLIDLAREIAEGRDG